MDSVDGEFSKIDNMKNSFKMFEQTVDPDVIIEHIKNPIELEKSSFNIKYKEL